MSVQDFIALALVAVAALYVGRTLWRMLNAKAGCASHCGCGEKPKQSDTPATSQRGLKRVALVTLEQVGKPEPCASADTPHLN